MYPRIDIPVELRHHYNNFMQDSMLHRVAVDVALAFHRNKGIHIHDTYRRAHIGYWITFVRPEYLDAKTDEWRSNPRVHDATSAKFDGSWVSGGSTYQGIRSPIYVDAKGVAHVSGEDHTGRQLDHVGVAHTWSKEFLGYQYDNRYGRTHERDAVLVMRLDAFLYLTLGYAIPLEEEEPESDIPNF